MRRLLSASVIGTGRSQVRKGVFYVDLFRLPSNYDMPEKIKNGK